MKNFAVRDIQGLFGDWNFDGYTIKGKQLTSKNDQAIILADIEKLKPVMIYQDGSVRGTKDNHSVIVVNESQELTDDDFCELWELFGYPEQPISE